MAPPLDVPLHNAIIRYFTSVSECFDLFVLRHQMGGGIIEIRTTGKI